MTNANHNFNTIDFAIYLTRSGNVNVYESGSYKGKKSTYVSGDVFKVERTGVTGIIKYYKKVLTPKSFEGAVYLFNAQICSFLSPCYSKNVVPRGNIQITRKDEFLGHNIIS